MQQISKPQCIDRIIRPGIQIQLQHLIPIPQEMLRPRFRKRSDPSPVRVDRALPLPQLEIYPNALQISSTLNQQIQEPVPMSTPSSFMP